MPRKPKQFRLSTPKLQQRNRPSTAQRGYGGRWQRYRAWYLAHHPQCEICRHAATDVDHIKRINGRHDPLFWEPTNHQAMCHSCHSKKTAREGKGHIATV